VGACPSRQSNQRPVSARAGSRACAIDITRRGRELTSLGDPTASLGHPSKAVDRIWLKAHLERMDREIRQRIQHFVDSDQVVLFMKGTRSMPQCGFSATAVQILDELVDNYTTINVLSDQEVRQGIKDFSDWPTIPQLYLKGEFI